MGPVIRLRRLNPAHPVNGDLNKLLEFLIIQFDKHHQRDTRKSNQDENLRFCASLHVHNSQEKPRSIFLNF